jgi:Mg-chelatase subunit ChlD
VRTLAEEGVEGARRFLQRAAQGEEAVANRIAELRERLRRQFQRRVERRMEEYGERADELERVRVRSEEALRAQLAELQGRLDRARALDLSRVVDGDLLADVQAALLVPDASWNRPVKLGLWDRIKAALARLADWFRRLFGRKGRKPAPPPAGRDLTIASLAAGGRTLGPSALGEAIARLSPPQQGELKERVEGRIERKEHELQKEAEAKRQEAEAQRRALEAEREEARRRAELEADRWVREAEERRLKRELTERGLVAERNGELVVTYALVERFARLLLESELREAPGLAKLSLKGGGSTGVYEKARLRQPEEVAHLDIPSSLIAARLTGRRHIDEDTSFVYREVTSERAHVVLALDKSGSMDEGGKLVAAKKALLALYSAVRRKYPDAIIDVLSFDNDVRVLDLLELWECPAGSFTNTGEALRTAYLLLRSSRASRKELYVITDGLPESYTAPDGTVRSGNLDVAMESALLRAAELSSVDPLRFTLLLIKSDHPEYERAARLLARALDGELVVTDPDRLAFELLVRWAGGTETERAPRAAPEAAPAVPSPRTSGKPGRRRKADRRMGG